MFRKLATLDGRDKLELMLPNGSKTSLSVGNITKADEVVAEHIYAMFQKAGYDGYPEEEEEEEGEGE